MIGWLLLRGRARGRQWLDTIATMPLAIPGVVIAVGYLRVFHGWSVPGLGEPLTSTWLILVIVYAMRRLPYTVRGAYAALQQLPLALEEAGQKPRRQPGPHVLEDHAAADGTRAAGRRATGLRHLGGGSLLDHPAGAARGAGAALLRHLSLYAVGGREGAGAALGMAAIVLVAAGAWAATRLAGRSGGDAIFRA